MHKMLMPSKNKEGITLKVHNPATKLFLKEDGQIVPFTTYWRRRLACGDVVEKQIKKENVSIKKEVSKNKKKTEVES